MSEDAAGKGEPANQTPKIDYGQLDSEMIRQGDSLSDFYYNQYPTVERPSGILTPDEELALSLLNRRRLDKFGELQDLEDESQEPQGDDFETYDKSSGTSPKDDLHSRIYIAASSYRDFADRANVIRGFDIESATDKDKRNHNETVKFLAEQEKEFRKRNASRST